MIKEAKGKMAKGDKKGTNRLMIHHSLAAQGEHPILIL
jgi:hypothetical protein